MYEILLAYFMPIFMRLSGERKVVSMRSQLGNTVRLFLGLVLILAIALLPANGFVSRAAYVEGVEIAEDAYETLRKGTTKYNGVDYAVVDGYNPVYYYLNYADLREAFGADPQALIQHWVEHGRTNQERRVANKLVVRNARLGSSSYEYVVPSYQKTSKQKDGMTIIPGEIHSNGGMNRNQEDQARSIAQQIARHVFDQTRSKGKGTQIEMVAYASGIVTAYCTSGRELSYDEAAASKSKVYRTAYGVFIAREYTSAGATRALGLVLDYLDQYCQEYNARVQAEAAAKAAEEAAKAAASGSSSSSTTSSSSSTTNLNLYGPLKWVHVNANKWEDQWCQIVCDNHEAYADPTQGYVGYGKHPNQGGTKKDMKTYVKYATENDVITVVPQYIDGQGTISMDHQYNKVNGR